MNFSIFHSFALSRGSWRWGFVYDFYCNVSVLEPNTLFFRGSMNISRLVPSSESRVIIIENKWEISSSSACSSAQQFNVKFRVSSRVIFLSSIIYFILSHHTQLPCDGYTHLKPSSAIWWWWCVVKPHVLVFAASASTCDIENFPFRSRSLGRISCGWHGFVSHWRCNVEERKKVSQRDCCCCRHDRPRNNWQYYNKIIIMETN